MKNILSEWKNTNNLQFPVLTLITNIMGAVLIGFIVGITSDKEGISDNTVLFWKTGVCGGFTTFSTFSLEAFNLFDNKQYAAEIQFIMYLDL